MGIFASTEPLYLISGFEVLWRNLQRSMPQRFPGWSCRAREAPLRARKEARRAAVERARARAEPLSSAMLALLPIPALTASVLICSLPPTQASTALQRALAGRPQDWVRISGWRHRAPQVEARQKFHWARNSDG
jgi:hypothetical protein